MKKLWDTFATWEEAEEAWDTTAQKAAQQYPLKSLKKLPKMVGISSETAKNLKWKSLKWMILKDHQWKILRGFFKHPIRYGLRYLRSLFQKKPFNRDGDFFLYGLNKTQEFSKLVEDPKNLFVLGFSYCHKPFECPSGRFTPKCVQDRENPVCQQCFIGKAFHAVPTEQTIPLVIPTVHYIGEKIFEVVHENPTKKVIFLITACEMTLQMFGDWGNMVGIQGIGVRLDGRICNTMEAFKLSEEGIKPGLTVVLDETQKQILNLIKERRS